MGEKGISYTIIGWFTGLGTMQAYLLILGVLLGCGLGVPIPEDITLISAGMLAGMKTISLPGAFITGFIGVMIGDTILFTIGKKYGRRVFNWPVFSRVFTEKRVAEAELRIQANARFICFVARFLPGLRAPIFLTAGIMGVPYRIFFLLDGMAALISVPAWVYLGYLFGDNIDLVLKYAKKMNISLLTAAGAFAIGYLVYRRLKEKRK